MPSAAKVSRVSQNAREESVTAERRFFGFPVGQGVGHGPVAQLLHGSLGAPGLSHVVDCHGCIFTFSSQPGKSSIISVGI